MSSPDWLNDSFAGVMLIVALYSFGRLVASRSWSRPTHRDVDLAHVLMGTAMAGMLVPVISALPSGVWEVVFAGLALWFVWRCYKFVAEHGVEGRDEDHVHHLSHYLTHLVMTGAMLYMYVAGVAPKSGPGGGMAMGAATGTTANFVGVPLFFLFVLFASGIWELDGIERVAAAGSTRAQTQLVVVSAGTDGSLTAGEGVSEAGSPEEDQGPGSESAQARRWLAPRLEAGCHIAMCITMGFMLVLML
jgi:hypothetical protein